MTAIVGVLNKHGMSIASDSAETIGNGVKIYNKANKIFTLSKYSPVGVAIYSSASFSCLVPWEIIIKMYRKQLGDTKFKTLTEYVDDFFKFLDVFRKNYLKVDEYKSVLKNVLYSFYYEMVLSRLPNFDPAAGKIDPKDIPLFEKELNNLKSLVSTISKFNLFSTLTQADFVVQAQSFFDEVEKQFAGSGADYTKLEPLIKETFFSLFTCDHDRRGYTGLAFFGYGEDEIYPSLHQVLVYDCYDDTIIKSASTVYAISNDISSKIIPLAQTEVMETYMMDINPELQRSIVDLTEQTMKSLLSSLATKDASLAATISTVDLKPFIKAYEDNIDKFKHQASILPLFNTVSTMEKEDLAELAENLIYLTSLKKRITPTQESVGGPIDVAIISKGDGFVWMKRKQYFDPALNTGFVHNYFK